IPSGPGLCTSSQRQKASKAQPEWAVSRLRNPAKEFTTVAASSIGSTGSKRTMRKLEPTNHTGSRAHDATFGTAYIRRVLSLSRSTMMCARSIGGIFAKSHSIPRSVPHEPSGMANVIVAIQELVAVFKPHCGEYSTLDELAEVAADRSRWRKGHDLFDRI